MNKENVLKEKTLNKPSLKERLRSNIISIAWKLFHNLFGNKPSLEETAKKYSKKTGTKFILSDQSKDKIDKFKRYGKGIIISNHPSGVFSDYLPVFASLGDEILKKSIFYTGSWNLKMNQTEFPDCTFRSANNLWKTGLIQLQEDIKKVNEKGGFLFIIPSWADTSENRTFKGIFKRIITNSENNLPVLSCKVKHNWKKGYLQLAKSLFTKKGGISTVNIEDKTIKDWKDKEGKPLSPKEMRAVYEGSLINS